MVNRIKQIYDQKDSMNRDELLRSALIKWDNDQGHAMKL